MQVGRGLSLATLRGLPMFERVPDSELEHLARVSTYRKVTRGTTIVRAGDVTDSLYILISGSIKVLNSDEEGREVILAILGTGEFFGEMGLLDGEPRSANVVALEVCEVLIIAKAEFRRLLTEHVDLTFYLLRSLVQRLREADRKIESLALMDVFGRVANLLLEFSEVQEGRRIVTRKLTKQDIAKMIGASREMVSRVMKDLETSGYIEIQDGRIVLNET